MEFLKKNVATVVAAAAVIIAVTISFALFGPAQRPQSEALVALVHDGEGGEQRLPLSEDTTLTITTELGTNTIVVENGAARIDDADCPRGDCLRQAPITQPGQQLICLPHKFWVEVVAEGNEGDGTLDVGAVTWRDAGDERDAASEQDSTDVDLVAR